MDLSRVSCREDFRRGWSELAAESQARVQLRSDHDSCPCVRKRVQAVGTTHNLHSWRVQKTKTWCAHFSLSLFLCLLSPFLLSLSLSFSLSLHHSFIIRSSFVHHSFIIRSVVHPSFIIRSSFDLIVGHRPCSHIPSRELHRHARGFWFRSMILFSHVSLFCLLALLSFPPFLPSVCLLSTSVSLSALPLPLAVSRFLSICSSFILYSSFVHHSFIIRLLGPP